VLAAVTGAGGAMATTTTRAPTGSSIARSATPGVTATTITVAGLADVGRYGDVDVGARARFARANAEGGVNGRTIVYDGVTDDGGGGATGAKAATSVLAKGVFAVVPVATNDFAGAKTLVRRKVPYFGWGLAPGFCGNDLGFGFTGCRASSTSTSGAWTAGIAATLAAGGSHTVSIVTEATASGRAELRALRASAAAAKLRVTYAKASLPVPAPTDDTALAKTVLTSAGGQPPGAVLVVGSYSNVVGVGHALRAAGYLGIVSNRVQYDPDLVGPSLGITVAIDTAPVETALANPAMAQLVVDVRKIAPGQPIDQSVIAGYLSADLFLAAVQRAGSDLTAAKLVAANGTLVYSLAGVVGPTRFPAAHRDPTPCGALVRSDGTTYTVVQPYRCAKVVRVR